mmetsp:Transcript_4197/g.6147  ORF Transcript_4197/g.6147 Transcript_4197/m.6147 type:complete len:110 (+) Transcript_4197:375-704(+)
MKYLAAYMLIALSGSEPTKDSVKELLSSQGVEVDSKDLDFMFTKLEGKTLEELIASGKERLLTIGGGSGGAAAGGAGGAAAAEEEEEEAEEEEEVDVGGGGLFGGDDAY